MKKIAIKNKQFNISFLLLNRHFYAERLKSENLGVKKKKSRIRTACIWNSFLF